MEAATVPDVGSADDAPSATPPTPTDPPLVSAQTKKTAKEGGAAQNGNSTQRAAGAKRHRRNKKGGKHHRKWKPYDKLTWDEKQQLQERESQRACQKRQQRFASGLPVAPYNTSQYLMEIHEADLPGAIDAQPRSDSSDDYEVSGAADDAELGDFAQDYETECEQRLQALSKDQLVHEFLQVEAKVDQLETRLRDRDRKIKQLMKTSDGGEALRQEVEKLRQENERLRRENQQLGRQPSKSVDGESDAKSPQRDQP